MRVGITKRLPPSYSDSADSLLTGRIYNLDSALASALIADGCADLYESPTREAQKPLFEEHRRSQMWEAQDRARAPRWK